MMPADDATWLACVTHNEKHWCDNIRDSLIAGTDADLVEPGLRYCVPIVPQSDLYAEVSVDSESFANGSMAMMYLIKPKPGPIDPFSGDPNEDMLSLGMWSKGEGRLVMASAIQEWVDANTVPKCDQNSHSFEQEMQLQGALKVADSEFAKCNRWTLAYYQMCYVCFAMTGADPNFHAPQNFTAAEFGLGPDNFTPAAQTPRAPGNVRQRDTMNALKNRFGV